MNRSLQGSAPAITGWFSTVMIQSGDTAKYETDTTILFISQFQGSRAEKPFIFNAALQNGQNINKTFCGKSCCQVPKRGKEYLNCRQNYVNLNFHRSI